MTARDLPNYRATTAKLPTKSDRHELRGSRNFFSKKILNQPREKKRTATQRFCVASLALQDGADLAKLL